MIRILFICWGNICRSPMAEFIMKDLVKKAGVADRFEIASAATSTEDIGHPVYPSARRKLAEHGISCEGKRSRKVTARDYSRFDYLIVMDRINLHCLGRIIRHDPQHKIHLLLEYAGSGDEIDDPWYTDDFETAYREILRGCEGLLAALLPQIQR